MLALVALVALALLAVAVVALPLLREPTPLDRLGTLSDEQRERLRLAEERDAALVALRELEFDHRTGKIADADYAELIGDYRRRVAAALVALEGPSAQADGAPDAAARASQPAGSA